MCPGRTRNDEDWSSGFEQRRLNDDILGRMIPAAFKLANDGKIESSCDMRKLRWYVANASVNPARVSAETPARRATSSNAAATDSARS